MPEKKKVMKKGGDVNREIIDVSTFKNIVKIFVEQIKDAEYLLTRIDKIGITAISEDSKLEIQTLIDDAKHLQTQIQDIIDPKQKEFDALDENYKELDDDIFDVYGKERVYRLFENRTRVKIADEPVKKSVFDWFDVNGDVVFADKDDKDNFKKLAKHKDKYEFVLGLMTQLEVLNEEYKKYLEAVDDLEFSIAPLAIKVLGKITTSSQNITIKKEVKLPETFTKQEIYDKLVKIYEEQGKSKDEVDKLIVTLKGLSKGELLKVAKDSGISVSRISDFGETEDDRIVKETGKKNIDGERTVSRNVLKKKTVEEVKDKLQKGKMLKEEKEQSQPKSEMPSILESIKRREKEINSEKKEFFDIMKSGDKTDAIDKVVTNILFTSKGRTQPEEIAELNKKIMKMREELLESEDNNGYIVGSGYIVGAGEENEEVKPLPIDEVKPLPIDEDIVLEVNSKKGRKKNEFIEFMKQFRVDYKDFFDDELKGMGAREKNKMIIVAGSNVYKKMKQDGFLETEQGTYIPEESYPADEKFNESQNMEIAEGDNIAMYTDGYDVAEQIDEVTYEDVEEIPYYVEPLNFYDKLYATAIRWGESDGFYSKNNLYHDSNTLSQKYTKFNNQKTLPDYYFDEEGTNNTFEPRKAGSAEIYNKMVEHSRSAMAGYRMEGHKKYIDVMRKRLGVKL